MHAQENDCVQIILPKRALLHKRDENEELILVPTLCVNFLCGIFHMKNDNYASRHYIGYDLKWTFIPYTEFKEW